MFDSVSVRRPKQNQSAFELIDEMRNIRASCKRLQAQNEEFEAQIEAVNAEKLTLSADNDELRANMAAIQEKYDAVSVKVEC